MSENKSGHFKVIKVTKLDEISTEYQKNKKNFQIPESDLTIQTDTELIQFEYKDVDDKERQKFIIKEGCFNTTNTNMGVILEKFKLRDYKLLKTIDNTSMIIAEKNKFFNRLDVYKELKKEPKRAILLCSPPGVGKTAAINTVCKQAMEEEGTAIIIWDTSEIRATDISKFFTNGSQFDKKVKKLIMVIEDVEGGTSEENYGARSANSSLLNFLDGVGSPFKGVPTFIIATTNNPEQSVGALIDRPGRFDKVLELKTPSARECRDLLKFILGIEELDDSQVEAAKLSAKNEFSIAHVQEAVVRSKLEDISILEATEQLVDHKKRFKEAFSQAAKGGVGLMA